MIKRLQISGTGPAARMEMSFAERLNLITGDNGLGKTFLLDIVWWALTRRWPAEVNAWLTVGSTARPRTGEEKKASIAFTVMGKTKEVSYSNTFDPKLQAWVGRAGSPSIPGLVLYAQVDGSFAVWDPARNYWRRKGDIDVQDRPPAYVFSPVEIWNGLTDKDGKRLCNGLIADWAGWQKENGESFRLLTALLEQLSPSEEEKICPGALTRISLDDSRDIPTLAMPYGQAVPILNASSGIRRIAALAYLLVWSWQEHRRASELLADATTSRIVFLIDEVEAHLHPKWQRRIVGSLLRVVEALASDATVQLVISTHSPLIMSAAEPVFRMDRDAWFDLDFYPQNSLGQQVEIRSRPFLKQGDVSNWLTSQAFDLKYARSAEAEALLNEAAEALSDETFDVVRAKELDTRLRGLLSDVDPFWIRWRFVAERKGWIKTPDPEANGALDR